MTDLTPPVSNDASAPARIRAARLFTAAARDDAGLSRTAQLRCLHAVTALAVTVVDHPNEPTATSRSGAPAVAEQLIRDALHTLGSLDIDLFGDPRIRLAATHGRRALLAAR
jgi:hypothetical protein